MRVPRLAGVGCRPDRGRPDDVGVSAVAKEAAGTLRRILAAVRRGELTAPAGLVARLEGAAAAWEALADRRGRRRD